MEPHKILVVDDESDLVELLALRLERAGFRVASACDPEEGLALAESFAPDAILLDVSMPGIDGWEFCRRLRRADRPFPRVLIMTAWQSSDLRRLAREAGAAGVMLKPFDEKEVVASVGALAAAARA